MAHTLTFDSHFQVLVNDTAVSSPYTLQNGDVVTIQVPLNSGGYAFYANYVRDNFNITAELSAENPPNLSVNDSDITLTARNNGGGAD